MLKSLHNHHFLVPLGVIMLLFQPMDPLVMQGSLVL